MADHQKAGISEYPRGWGFKNGQMTYAERPLEPKIALFSMSKHPFEDRHSNPWTGDRLLVRRSCWPPNISILHCFKHLGSDLVQMKRIIASNPQGCPVASAPSF